MCMPISKTFPAERNSTEFLILITPNTQRPWMPNRKLWNLWTSQKNTFNFPFILISRVGSLYLCSYFFCLQFCFLFAFSFPPLNISFCIWLWFHLHLFGSFYFKIFYSLLFGQSHSFISPSLYHIHIFIYLITPKLTSTYILFLNLH